MTIVARLKVSSEELPKRGEVKCIDGDKVILIDELGITRPIDAKKFAAYYEIQVDGSCCRECGIVLEAGELKYCSLCVSSHEHAGDISWGA